VCIRNKTVNRVNYVASYTNDRFESHLSLSLVYNEGGYAGLEWRSGQDRRQKQFSKRLFFKGCANTNGEPKTVIA
jgi:hypothetical protein